MEGTQTEGLDDLPPSAKLVFKVLEYNGPLTQKGSSRSRCCRLRPSATRSNG